MGIPDFLVLLYYRVTTGVPYCCSNKLSGLKQHKDLLSYGFVGEKSDTGLNGLKIKVTTGFCYCLEAPGKKVSLFYSLALGPLPSSKLAMASRLSHATSLSHSSRILLPLIKTLVIISGPTR